MTKYSKELFLNSFNSKTINGTKLVSNSAYGVQPGANVARKKNANTGKMLEQTSEPWNSTQRSKTWSDDFRYDVIKRKMRIYKDAQVSNKGTSGNREHRKIKEQGNKGRDEGIIENKTKAVTSALSSKRQGVCFCWAQEKVASSVPLYDARYIYPNKVTIRYEHS